MNTKTLLLGVVGLVLVIAFTMGGYYNGFVTQTNGIDGQWKQVEVQYQRRYDLIPNLVESVKGAQIQEQTVFGDIAKARQNYAGARTTDEKINATNEVEGALGRLLVIMENYPQIKSDATVMKLMDELAGTENRVSVERRRYNDLVQGYNTGVSVVPGKFVASMFGFSTRQYFNAEVGAEKAPKVDFTK